MTDIKSMNRNELKSFFLELGEPAFRADQVFSWIHEKLSPNFDSMTNIKKDLRERLSREGNLTEFEVADVLSSKDGTKKFLFRLEDGSFLESVLMEYEYGSSVCVSTQVGCAMNCSFCASGKGGFERNLTPGEIVEQVYAISRREKKKIGRVVFMGMGEPLLNYENLLRAIELFTNEKGQNMSIRHMTVSTCGIVPGIKQLSLDNPGITLALSLHSPFQEKRKEIMPISSKYPLEEVLLACEEYRIASGRRVTYEYCLIPGVNDGPEDVKELVKIMKGKDTHLNLIPVHKIAERDYGGEPDSFAFKNKLEKYGINVTIRRGLGQDIDASCGQLRMKANERKVAY